MYKVKIYGAGSIGNHLAHGCRVKGWDVLICDCDKNALKRTKQEIYPGRYGEWDKNIRLAEAKDASREKADVVIIGTPPDTHIGIALDVLRISPPRALIIEKPLCPPSLSGVAELERLAHKTGTFVGVGYNHTLTENTRRAQQVLLKEKLGNALTISAYFREFWGGIFKAHPWLRGPRDSYLGFYKRGGAATGEHSHAINIWQHFSHVLDKGRITEVSATLDMVKDGSVLYDRLCLVNVKTEKGLVGNIIQDVITQPPQKSVRIQMEKGFLEWHVNFDKDHDAVFYSDKSGKEHKELISKTRPDDFRGEIDHIEEILSNKNKHSAISLSRGLETMLVVSAVYQSHRSKRTVKIDYKQGYSKKALKAA